MTEALLEIGIILMIFFLLPEENNTSK